MQVRELLGYMRYLKDLYFNQINKKMKKRLWMTLGIYNVIGAIYLTYKIIEWLVKG